MVLFWLTVSHDLGRLFRPVPVGGIVWGGAASAAGNDDVEIPFVEFENDSNNDNFMNTGQTNPMHIYMYTVTYVYCNSIQYSASVPLSLARIYFSHCTFSSTISITLLSLVLEIWGPNTEVTILHQQHSPAAQQPPSASSAA